MAERDDEQDPRRQLDAVRQLAHARRDEAAETAVLGDLFLQPATVPVVARTLTPEHFGDPRHATIYWALLEVWRSGDQLGLTTVTEFLRNNNRLNTIGGPQYLSELHDIALGGTVDAERNAEIVLDEAIARTVALGLQELLVAAVQGRAGRELLELFAQKARQIAERFSPSQSQSYAAATDQFLSEYVSRAESGNTLAGIPTGFPELDELMGGLCEGEFIILAADTGSGKSALALNLSLNVARHTGAKVLFVSLEMKGKEVAGRGLCLDAGVNMNAFRTMSVSDADWSRINAATARAATTPLLINDDVRVTLARLRAEALLLRQQRDLSMVVVDYVQLLVDAVRRANKGISEVEAVGMITRELKLLAMELGVPVLALSQFNKGGTQRVERSPGAKHSATDLKGNSSIGQDANTILLLKADKEARTAEINVVKHRSARTGAVTLRFIPELTKFESMRESAAPSLPAPALPASVPSTPDPREPTESEDPYL
jgi:replicative DNA helicase